MPDWPDCHRGSQEDALITARKPISVSAFTSEESGIGCYRIRSLVVFGNGELLAMLKARFVNGLDHAGPIRIGARLSSGNGVTWGPRIQVTCNILQDGSEHVARNPSPVVDLLDPYHPADKVVLMFNKAD